MFLVLLYPASDQTQWINKRPINSLAGHADFRIYCKTLDRSPRLLSVQTVLTPGLYPGPGIYVRPGFYQVISKSLIFAADALAHGSYYIRLMLLGIMFPPISKTISCILYPDLAYISVQITLTRACIWDPAFMQHPASIQSFTVFWD